MIVPYLLGETSPHVILQNVSTTCDRSLGINHVKSYFSFLCTSGKGAKAGEGEEDDTSLFEMDHCVLYKWSAGCASIYDGKVLVEINYFLLVHGPISN